MFLRPFNYNFLGFDSPETRSIFKYPNDEARERAMLVEERARELSILASLTGEIILNEYKHNLMQQDVA